MTKANSFESEGTGCALLLLVAVAAIVVSALWLLDIPLARIADDRATATTQKIGGQIQKSLPEAKARIERKGNALVVYLERSDFQSIPYPEQSSFVVSVAKKWFRAAEGKNFTFARLDMRDIHTGEILGKERCVGMSENVAKSSSQQGITVTGSDGRKHAFPPGTSLDKIDAEMSARYPKDGRDPEAGNRARENSK
jgi:hypothetical protein